MKQFTRPQQSRRGSLLIVAMMLCAIIGISLGSYLHLSRTTLNISNRALYHNAAMNLAEQGIEEAMFSVNQFIDNSTYAWPGWTLSGPNAYREWTGIGLSQNATAAFRVYVYNYLGVAAPKVVSRARVTLGNGGAPIEKYVEVTLLQTSKFANGLVAKNSIMFNGNNASVDSWNSEENPNGTPRTPPVTYSSTYRNDNGSVGSISIATDAVVVQNADVWGYVSNNSGSTLHPPEEFVGNNGSILGDDSPTGTKVDPNRTSTTFSATLDPADLPPETAIVHLGVISGGDPSTEGFILPRSGDTVPNGAAGTDYEGYYIYDATRIDLNNTKMSIKGKVVLRLDDTASSFTIVGGDGELNIQSAAYFSIYTPGNVSIAGKGVSNGVDGADAGTSVDQVSELGQPKQFQLWGTKTSGTQTMAFAGSGLFSGVLYAPNASVSIVGNGAVCGSVVAGDIVLAGNAQFHYDESLAKLGADNPYRISKWKELTSATDRNAYASILNWVSSP
jgi:hypothetical protein